MIYVTGDCHGGFQRFGAKYFPQQKELGRDDDTIICGDFGGIWKNTPKERYWLDWPEEMPSEAEYIEAVANLNKAGWCVDCILPHCAPTGILGQIDPSYQPEQLTEFLESVPQRCRFQYWLFGHYHTNRIIDSKYILQWEQISQIQ